MDKFHKPQNSLKRLFVAVKIIPDTRFMDMYSTIRDILSKERIRWVRPENLHITMRFLGETDPGLILLIVEQLSLSFADVRPFNLDLAGLGIFRSLGNPKVLWIGLRSSVDLISVKKKMDDHLKSVMDLKETGNDNMHLTIGRMKSIINRDDWQGLLDDHHDLGFLETRVEKIILFESILGKTGPVYNELYEFPMKI